LRAPVHAFFSHMCEVALPCLSGRVEDGGALQFSLNHHGGDINLKLKSELAGVPFYWEFRCTPAPVALVRSIYLTEHQLYTQLSLNFCVCLCVFMQAPVCVCVCTLHD
jgi:hypothetical protein